MRTFAVAAVGAIVAFASLAPAAGVARSPSGPPTHVTFNRWNLKSHSGAEKSGPAGSTIVHCTSEDFAFELELFGRVKHAENGKNFNEVYTLNGKVEAIFHHHWIADGAGSINPGFSEDKGIDDGHWKLKLVEAGKTIGQSSISLEANPSC